MESILKSILTSAKEAYRESIRIDHSELEEKLLSIITNTQLLLEESKNQRFSKTSNYSKINDEDTEIQKVKNRVLRWIKNPDQYNAKILNTFMALSNNNQHPIPVSTLEKHSGLNYSKFITNYNQMKIIAERNHGKVFEEKDGEVTLWEPVAEFIMDLYANQEKGEHTMQNKDDIIRKLNSVGKEIFVKYFDTFWDYYQDTISKEQCIETLVSDNISNFNGAAIRCSNAYAIFNAKATKIALQIVIDSNRLPYEIKQKAREVIKTLY